MTTISAVSSTSANAEASQIIGTLNALIANINASLAPTGAGALSLINIPAVTSAVNLPTLTAGASGSPVQFTAGGPSAETNVSVIVAGAGSGDVALGGGGTLLSTALTIDGVAASASIVNGFVVAGASSSGVISLLAQGSDTNINVLVGGKGTGNVALGGLQTTAGAGLIISGVASVVNQITVTAAATSAHPAITATGSDTNINITLSPKGTGQLRMGVASMFAANGTVAATLTTTTAPTGARTSIQKWLAIQDQSGTTFFIPVF